MNKKRTAKLTRGLYCEGPEDKVFASLVKEYYHTENIQVNIRNGNGKDQTYLVTRAHSRFSDNDEIFVLLDSDKPQEELAKADAKACTLGIKHIIRCTPNCAEGLMLRILKPASKLRNLCSDDLKKQFEAEYIPERHRSDIAKYRRTFPKELFEEARMRIPELDELIRVFTDLT